MVSERMQRQIDAILDQAESAVGSGDWQAVQALAARVLAIDATNADALAFLAMAGAAPHGDQPEAPAPAPSVLPAAVAAQPESFVGGRYHVRRFLGEGGKKKVFLAHDALLDRDVAFALIKTDGLDATGRERITREAQAMGRMGSHPHIVSVFDLGDEGGAPYIVTELMGGGDVETELGRAGGALELTRALELAKGVARGLQFAHEHEVIHRDLKPGNVWLTADGVPKIGDFGLAVAQGRSRLTQHGLMVGTFGYMPPEQALGADATPQSDLYSFGCMLYELVTGKQPFTGETPTAVISQHLNTPPVAPSWHSEHCPPVLEDLILALLAKDPAARPRSAGEVLATLESVDPAQRSRSRSDSGANPLDRLATGVFVGRERELERLRSALDGALAGHGSLVMLVGEPGVGKTRTTQELETYARMRGAKVLWGRANESAGAPPYWPWLLAARDYRDQTPDDELRRKQYEPYAVDLQRIFPALRELFPNLPPPLDADSEEGQFRLYDALSGFLRSVAVETPLLVVLDDLHWADTATLAMLAHITRELGRARVLVLGTYRDTDLDRRHPLAQALAELNREELFLRIPLRGLTLAETADYIRRTADITPAPAIVARIHEETEGNPFFLSEVVNLMAEEGTLSSPLADVQIPEGVRQALGRRLDRLSDDANALLTTLAVVGRDFDHPLVLALSEHDAATTLRLIEEALRARVVEETSVAGRYRFRHALMQQTLLDELSAARRVLLHGQIADALLATYGADNRDNLTALAEHYAESALLNPAHARLAAATLRRAAGVAETGLAWDEAARLYERCLGLATAADARLGEDEGRLWLALAMVRFANANDRTAWEAFDHAAALLDATTLAPAIMDIAKTSNGGLLAPRRALWRRLAESVMETPSIAAYQLLAVSAVADTSGEDGDLAAARANAMAQSIGIDDPITSLLLAMREMGGKLQAAGDYAAVLTGAEALRSQAASAGALQRVVNMAMSAANSLGDLDRAEHLRTENIALLRAGGNNQQANAYATRQLRADWRRRGVAPEWLETAPAGPLLDLFRAEIALEAGDIEGARRALPSLDHPLLGRMTFGSVAMGARCRVLFVAGDSAATTEFKSALSLLEDATSVTRLTFFNALDDAVCTLADRALLEEVAAELARRPQLRNSENTGTGPDYQRGAIALTFERVDEAEGHFRTGLEWATHWAIEVIMGRNLYGLAEVDERRGDHALAMEHLDAAGQLFAKRGAKLYLDQVIAKKQILKA